ncbi:hypothetical protein ACYFX5_04925 [Bremerella sp. T1]|uniref:hypothetical protein n=1 Tax=Bremerella sp. TYQ1 TaxID=3119568 RepID=UPI001CD03380|nr:hypothetical protein [Bremerella volcania]UBM37607.1 hypothetical protein LA756_06880 [Bremerella volcania]
MEPYEGGPGEQREESEHRPAPDRSKQASMKSCQPLLAFAILAVVGMLPIVFIGGVAVWEEGQRSFLGWAIATLPFVCASFACLWKFARSVRTNATRVISYGAVNGLGCSVLVLSALAVVISFSICASAVLPIQYH